MIGAVNHSKQCICTTKRPAWHGKAPLGHAQGAMLLCCEQQLVVSEGDLVYGNARTIKGKLKFKREVFSNSPTQQQSIRQCMITCEGVVKSVPQHFSRGEDVS